MVFVLVPEQFPLRRGFVQVLEPHPHRIILHLIPVHHARIPPAHVGVELVEEGQVGSQNRLIMLAFYSQGVLTPVRATHDGVFSVKSDKPTLFIKPLVLN